MKDCCLTRENTSIRKVISSIDQNGGIPALIIDDKDTFVDYVENLIKIANLVTSDEFLNRAGRWAKEIDKLRKPYLNEIKTIKAKPSEPTYINTAAN